MFYRIKPNGLKNGYNIQPNIYAMESLNKVIRSNGLSVKYKI